jgi:hypothetical protein
VGVVRILFAVLRIAIAIAVIAAVVGQLVTSVHFWFGSGLTSVTTQVINFFSFFTIESNVLTAVIMLIGAYILLTKRGADASWFQNLRLATFAYMATTGIVYNLLLRGIELPQGSTLGWSNEILHLVAPLYVILDWLLAPGRSPISWKTVWGVLVFPIAWCLYTLIRGPLTYDAVYRANFWYPYPFLNPNTSPEGYASVAFYIVLIAVVISALCVAGVAISKKKLPQFTQMVS